MKKKVIIIGHGYTSRLAVIRSVAQIGCEVTVIVMTSNKKDGKTLDTTKPIDCYSKFVGRILYCNSDEERLVKLLLDECVDKYQKVILFPDSDFSAAVIDNHQNKLKEHFVFPHIGHRQGALVEWMNKEKQKDLARKFGLNVANSVTIDVSGGKCQIPETIHYPCFTKTRSYMVGTKQTLKRCDTKEDLQEFVSYLGSKYCFTLLVEDYKKIETEYAVLGFSDGHEVIIPGVVQVVSLAHGNHFGVACTGKVMPTIGFEDLISKYKRFVLETGYVGVFDIDFYKSDGNFYFGELNLRIGGSCYAITKTGVNLPGMMVKHLCGDSIVNMPKSISVCASYVNERMLMDDWLQHHISTWHFMKQLKSTDISFIKDSEDTAPQKIFSHFLRRQLVKRLIKIIVGRQ